MMKYKQILFTIALYLAFTGTVCAEWFSDAGLSVVYEDNLDRAVAREYRKDDFAVIPRILFGQYLQLSDLTRLTVNADLADTRYERYSGLDNIAAGLTVSLKYKTGLGSYVPWVAAYGSGVILDYREHFRDGSLARTGLVMGKRLDERFFAQVGYEYESMRAQTSVFDSRNGTASIKAGLLLTESAQMTLGYAVGSGRCVVYEAPAPGYGYGYGYGGAQDNVVVNTFNTPMEAYAVHYDSQIYSIAMNTSFDSHWSTEVRVERREIHSEGKGYPDTSCTATVWYAY